jgi:hypothetical protein
MNDCIVKKFTCGPVKSRPLYRRRGEGFPCLIGTPPPWLCDWFILVAKALTALERPKFESTWGRGYLKPLDGSDSLIYDMICVLKNFCSLCHLHWVREPKETSLPLIAEAPDRQQILGKSFPSFSSGGYNSIQYPPFGFKPVCFGSLDEEKSSLIMYNARNDHE